MCIRDRGRVSGFEGFSSAKNATPLRQGFAGRRKQGFKGKMRRRREGLLPKEDPVAVAAVAAAAVTRTKPVDPNLPVDSDKDLVNTAKLGDSFVGNRGRRRRR